MKIADFIEIDHLNLKTQGYIKLIGSSSLKQEFDYLYTYLFTNSLVVKGLTIYSKSLGISKISSHQLNSLVNFCLTDIKTASCVIAVTKNGSLGEATISEINFALNLNIPVFIYSKISDSLERQLNLV